MTGNPTFSPPDDVVASILARLEKLESSAALFEQHRQEWLKLGAALAADRATES